MNTIDPGLKTGQSFIFQSTFHYHVAQTSNPQPSTLTIATLITIPAKLILYMALVSFDVFQHCFVLT